MEQEINLLKPEEIKGVLDDYVIGQDDAEESTGSSGLQSLQENPGGKRPGGRAAEK